MQEISSSLSARRGIGRALRWFARRHPACLDWGGAAGPNGPARPGPRLPPRARCAGAEGSAALGCAREGAATPSRAHCRAMAAAEGRPGPMPEPACLARQRGDATRRRSNWAKVRIHVVSLTTCHGRPSRQDGRLRNRRRGCHCDRRWRRDGRPPPLCTHRCCGPCPSQGLKFRTVQPEHEARAAASCARIASGCSAASSRSAPLKLPAT